MKCNKMFIIKYINVYKQNITDMMIKYNQMK